MIRQLAPCCQHVVIVCWLFFNFAVSFDFGCCSLAQEMSSVDCYLPYFRQQLITCPLWALLPFQPLFSESSHGAHPLAPPPFSSELSTTVPCLFFIVFLWWGCQSAQGAMLVYPRGGWGNTSWQFVLTSLVCQMSSKQFWSQGLVAWEPSCFCSAMWCGEVFHGLGVQGAKVFILLAAFFPPSVASVSPWGFGVTELTLSASAP
jgi:hypothetical protein